MIPIVQAPHIVLSSKAKKVGKIDKSIKKLIKDMTEALIAAKDPEGVGLAAPQVGKGLQLFIVRPTPESEVTVYINPELKMLPDTRKNLKTKRKTGVKLEGCLSLQDIWGVVQRHQNVEMTYLDETGKVHTRKFTGFMATIMQHEYDHLQGILFPKHVIEQGNKLYKSYKTKDNNVEFEEIDL